MFLGRSLTLWTGAIAAVLDALVILGVIALDGQQVAALNGCAAAVLALLSTSDTLAVAKGRAAAARLAAKQ